MRAAGDDTPANATQDAGSDAGGDTWMTYREIAAARGITHAAAIRLVQRQGGRSGRAATTDLRTSWCPPTRRRRHPTSDGPVIPIVLPRHLFLRHPPTQACLPAP
jgi:hypothetical protein